MPPQDVTSVWVIYATEIDFDKNGCGDILISTEQHSQDYSEVIWLNDCFGHFTALPNAVLGKVGFMIPIDSDMDGDLDFIVGRKKFPNTGENWAIRHQDLALLRREREPSIVDLLSDSLCSSGCGTTDNIALAFLGNKARFIPSLSQLFIPSVHVDNNYYQISMSFLPNSPALRFRLELDSLAPLFQASQENLAFVDGGNLIIPVVEIIQGETVSRYRVTLTLVDSIALEFELTRADSVP